MTALLELDDLTLSFQTSVGDSQVLRGMTMSVEAGTIIGLVGESGCGKSMTARSIMRLTPGNAHTGGQIRFEGRDLLRASQAQMRKIRGREIAMIFQDPMAALNPMLTIGFQLIRIIRLREPESSSVARERALQLLREVGLGDPTALLKRYPHELSGGMQQRVLIAMALAGSPKLLIADEPTTALDVTIQAQILALLKDLRESRGITVLLITHDMAVVAQACQSIAVLYAGKVVETGPLGSVLADPKHPYTEALLAAVPARAAPGEHLRVIRGTVPGGRVSLPPCVFADRCPHVMEICRTEPPPVVSIGSQQAACWLYAKHP
jgi:oligopeptide/dipeptide ABC transporter ATP-binding protein